MEDYSINLSVFSKQKTSEDSDQVEEESGWTAYFEDFSNKYHHQQENSYCSSSSCGSSLISDAATTRGAAACKLSHKNIDHRHNHVFPRKLKLKKTRTKEICDGDDSLEDTASSPVNSPKVSDHDLKSNDMNPRKREDQTHSSLGKGIAPENYPDIQMEEESELNFHDCTELKKRGLCLVPLSMLVNHLG